ncbi:hypothetical protein SADUNF_Sadunf08G0028900 [Salix dunnii]|uniref:Uncharacterized protein n=1 Tax=Salix dunnii TaxID=1413687 RepID=A0A835MRX9_9ROSI|nr:hypothetical protein SADUNF_Sadunf08G0028900 [Salix dunnii]
MHLWPTMRIRESFKISYLKKYEWNRHRMNSEKKRQSQEANDISIQQRLLDVADENSTNQQQPSNNSKAVMICREILMVITCCYGCFCCGVHHNTKLAHVLIKTTNDAVLDGVGQLNLLCKDNISEGGTGIVQFSC